jgi:alpha-glucuronidase
MKKIFLLILLFHCMNTLQAEDGYAGWLRYKPANGPMLHSYRQAIRSVQTNDAVIKKELALGLNAMLQTNIPFVSTPTSHTLVIHRRNLPELGPEGFMIKGFEISANTDIGLLYGTFHFLRLLQTHQPIQSLNIVSVPQVKLRLLNHWDNLNRYVERGYAGISIWNWHTLPDYTDPRYIDYARLNASIGINGTVLNNVNANATVLTAPYLEKVAALANVFRPYGIKVYLSARFTAPMEIGHLSTADPANDSVRQWWKAKVQEIYALIPDFGGFLVKANSEGQPGPKSHSAGANMMAEALAPYGGIVIWRAFVYDPTAEDRFKQAYDEFKPLDGKFNKNVLVQVKNGPIDFQPREPISPLLSAMPHTPLMLEFQLTQEYLGQGTHLVYEAPMFKEILNADISVAGIAAVSNIGNDRNWTGHPFGQANWYAAGRLAWDRSLSSEQIANEWIRQTFGNDHVSDIEQIMLPSHEAVVNYMTPLGLHHIMGNGHHYGPAPWGNTLSRPDWNPVYYHRADSFGIGFNRDLLQYTPAMRQFYADNETYLLWFQHVSWLHKMHSGKTLWEELCYKYYAGVDTVRAMQSRWGRLEGAIDAERYNQVKMLLAIQLKEAIWWRNACLLYFQTFSKLPIPYKEQPDHTLEYYKQLRFPYAPGN